jgi:hypothetical protein
MNKRKIKIFFKKGKLFRAWRESQRNMSEILDAEPSLRFCVPRTVTPSFRTPHCEQRQNRLRSQLRL